MERNISTIRKKLFFQCKNGMVWLFIWGSHAYKRFYFDDKYVFVSMVLKDIV